MEIRITGSVIFSFCLLFLFSCVPNNPPVSNQYFDLRNYFEGEVQRLQVLNPYLNKRVITNGKEDNSSLANINWRSELDHFIQCDINKPAWQGLFAIDTIHISNRGDKYLLFAKDPSIPIKLVEITYLNGKITKLVITKFTSSFLFASSLKLSYIPDSSFEIVSSEKVLFSERDEFLTQGRFLE